MIDSISSSVCCNCSFKLFQHNAGRPTLPAAPKVCPSEPTPAAQINQRPSQPVEHKSKQANPINISNSGSYEQREYVLALSRIETFLRRRKKCLGDFMPARPSYSVPGIFSLRDFRMILQDINANEDGFQVLSRDQINVVFKLAPRKEGNVIDQKALQTAMTKAFASLGPQKLSIRKHQDLSPLSTPREKHVLPARNVVVKVAKNHEQIPPAAASVDGGPSSSTLASGSVVKKRNSVHPSAGALDHLDKSKMGKELVGQLAWLNSFDSRFDECQKKLEFVRDNSHLGASTT